MITKRHQREIKAPTTIEIRAKTKYVVFDTFFTNNLGFRLDMDK